MNFVEILAECDDLAKLEPTSIAWWFLQIFLLNNCISIAIFNYIFLAFKFWH